jgi:RNA polymerase sigma-54 factor
MISHMGENIRVCEICQQPLVCSNGSLGYYQKLKKHQNCERFNKVLKNMVPETVPASKELKEASHEDFGVDKKYIEDSENSEFKVSSGSYNSDEKTTFENFVSPKNNLREHLTTQLYEVHLSATQKKIGEYLIGLIDKNGYLRHSASQIADLLKIEQSVVLQLVTIIQKMNPLGVGAFDLKQCLLIQANEEGYFDDAVTAIIENNLQDLEQNKIANIVKVTGYNLEEIRAAADVICSFNPRPGASFFSVDDERYVSPDVFIGKIGDKYVVAMNESDLPKLRINNLYRVAIMKVAEAICEVQKDFLDFGVLHLKPLTLQDVANMAGLHESAVSRATSGKYAQTPRGLFELKFFFSGAARTQSGKDVSTLSVKKRIEDLIIQENPKKPLSDSAIVNILKKEGVFIARRTVAKYRIELNIPGSSARIHHY